MPPKQKTQPQPTPGRWNSRLIALGVRWHLLVGESGRPEDSAVALKERVKELNCLYAISQLMERESLSFEDLLGMIVDILPPSLQYPEVGCARIDMGGHTYDSLYFQESPWRLSATIMFQGVPTGEVTVYYTEPCPEEFEGPFLVEEHHLINAVAERLGHIAFRKSLGSKLEKTNRQLATEKIALREANSALRAIMGRIEVEKTEIQQNIVENVKKIILPILHELAMTVDPGQRHYLDLLEENLLQISSPFVRQLSHDFQSLTATEIQVCDMIRSGMGSKDIAALRGVSPATINRHREHIRKKLGITNSKANLATYLQSTM